MHLRPSSTAPVLADGAGAAIRALTPLVAVTLLGALVAGGVGSEIEHRLGTARAEAAAEQAYRAALADHVRASHSLRVDHAQSARLTGAAVQYAAVRRTEALAAARAAVEAARVVVVSRAASPDVPVETLTPLGDAATRLVELIEETPAVPAPPARVPGTAAAGQAAAAPSASTATTPAAVDPEAVAPRTPAGPGADTAPVARSAAEPVDPTRATGGPAAEPVTAPRGAATSSPVAPTLRSLDLEASAEIVAAARWVTDLSVHADAAADAAVAAAHAARVAEEKARVAEEKARVAEEKARAEAVAAVGELAERAAAAEAAPNGRIPLELLCAPETAPEHLLRCDAAAAFDLLAAAYRSDTGRDLRIVSGYRTFERQAELRASLGSLAAPPGRSNHGRAIAVDLADLGALGQFTAPAYLWMKEHARRFGWDHPAAMEPGGSGPPEPWHWEFGTEG